MYVTCVVCGSWSELCLLCGSCCGLLLCVFSSKKSRRMEHTSGEGTKALHLSIYKSSEGVPLLELLDEATLLALPKEELVRIILSSRSSNQSQHCDPEKEKEKEIEKDESQVEGEQAHPPKKKRKVRK